MAKKLTDEQMEAEISRLRASELVRLAERERAIRYRRVRYLNYLRCMERRGEELQSQGIDYDNMEQMLFGSAADFEEER